MSSLPPQPTATVLRGLAGALLSGEQTLPDAVERCEAALGRPWRWVAPLAARYLLFSANRVRPLRREVVAFLKTDKRLEAALEKHRRTIRIVNWLREPERMRPARAGLGDGLPVLETVADLAGWLGLTDGELAWMADPRGINPDADGARLGHYRYRVLAKGFGAVRLIEAPKERLKGIQRKILSDLLDPVRLHPAVHGFRAGRSIRSFAAPHCGQTMVLRMDLKEFFPGIVKSRVEAVFRTLGYPERVAGLLAGLCTHAAPRTAWRGVGIDVSAEELREAKRSYGRRHLPQGAPTSPALANLCAYRMDCRLTCLAEASVAVYTRYADDLAFSGGPEFARGAGRFEAHAAAIAAEEGFTVHHRKTRAMRQGVRQHLAGVVVNRRPNFARDEFDALKAILTNCRRHGPEGQNRAAHPAFQEHLAGRVEHVRMLNPARGEKLKRIFDAIPWPYERRVQPPSGFSNR